MTNEEKEAKVRQHAAGCFKCMGHALSVGIGNIRRGAVSREELKRGACARGKALIEQLWPVDEKAVP